MTVFQYGPKTIVPYPPHSKIWVPLSTERGDPIYLSPEKDPHPTPSCMFEGSLENTDTRGPGPPASAGCGESSTGEGGVWGRERWGSDPGLADRGTLVNTLHEPLHGSPHPAIRVLFEKTPFITLNYNTSFKKVNPFPISFLSNNRTLNMDDAVSPRPTDRGPMRTQKKTVIMDDSFLLRPPTEPPGFEPGSAGPKPAA